MVTAYSGKRIVVGVTGSIAAFKVAGWVSTLAKEEAIVSVIMTESATRFVTPLTFSALTGEKVHTDMFDAASGESMAHIMLGREADVIIIAPASAQTLARLAHGMAGDLLSTTVLAARVPVFICPAMNSRMYSHPATQDNLAALKRYGYRIIDPDEGLMACKEEGQGRLPEWEQVDEIFRKSLTRQDLAEKSFLVTAGPTREAIDPARFLSNRSSGKMGFALARAAYRRGAKVTLVCGPTSLPTPPGIERIDVQSARQMFDAVMARADDSDVIIKAAAVADYRAKHTSSDKVKKDQIGDILTLEQNRDILYELGRNKKPGQLLIGFAAESKDLESEARKKLERKNLDMIAVNDISSDSTGFESETNQVLLLTRGQNHTLPFTSKSHTADLILDRLALLHVNDSGNTV